MTTKPKPPAAETGINPKLLAIAAKLDEAKATVTELQKQIETYDDEVRLGPACTGEVVCKLEMKLAKVRAVSLEELKLKARYAEPRDHYDSLTMSIVRDLRALTRMSGAS